MSKPSEKSEYDNLENISKDEVDDIGLAPDAKVIVTSCMNRRVFHIPKESVSEDELKSVCPIEPQQTEWREKTVAMITPIYGVCSKCAHHIHEYGPEETAYEPEKVYPDKSGVVRDE